jgi:hypothetical protein
MASMTGKVVCILIQDDVAITTIRSSEGIGEPFILWSNPDPEPPVHVRVIQSNWISLLREAIASDLDVTVVGDNDSSAYVASVQLGTIVP